MSKKPTKILITGACGQIGTELVATLREIHGEVNVFASDIRDRSQVDMLNYYSLNVLNVEAIEWLLVKLDITEIYHLAAVLSATGEQRPMIGWELNMQGLLNVLECARKRHIEKVFWPSSIAVFGPASPKAACPQDALTDPSTVYGISKVAGESWCKYYNEKYAMDIRSLRYPGLISHNAKPGGGTTDYAVDMFHKALQDGGYTCFLKESTTLPMLYMPDAIRATLELMGTPKMRLSVKTAYNLGGLSFTPYELANAIGKRVPGFQVKYEPDERQQIADSWPWTIDDHHARFDWNWKPKYDMQAMVDDMLAHLKLKYQTRTIA